MHGTVVKVKQRSLRRSAQRHALTMRVLFWILAGAFAIALQGGTRCAMAQGAAACTAGAAGAAAAALPCLATLVRDDTASGIYPFNGLELAAAQADDAAYENLLNACGPTGAGCKGAQLGLFDRLRSLEDNAAELLGFGETQFSQNLSTQALGFALRWTADEEFSAQGSITNRIASSQFEAVANRLGTVQAMMQTLRLARNGYEDDSDDDGDATSGTSYRGSALGGAAGSDYDATQIGRWGVFASAAYDSGTKEPTTFNDAFSFGGTQIEAGADIRLTPGLIVGVLLNDVQQHADFNSVLSIVSGNVKGSGGGLTGYAANNWGAFSVNGSLGVQRMSLDSRRVVAYPSNNAQIASVDSSFFSSTNATSVLASAGAAYIFYLRAFSAEPYLNWEYIGTRIGAFAETGRGTDPEFAVSVAGQSISSLQSVVGMKLQYAISSRLGVVNPYAYGEFRHEFRDESQAISSQYENSSSAPNHFQLPTDNIDPNYYEVGGGLSVVLPHRLELHAQYMKVLQLQNYSYYAVFGGFRYGF
jgi:uncharacterized protein YhjY with autotransporter beta-barrel domain